MHQGQQQKLTHALNKEGILVHVDSVPNGNGCGCICPCCKNELCAKNEGEERIHHFAHLGGADCSGGIESALHLMAKNILNLQLLLTISEHLPTTISLTLTLFHSCFHSHHILTGREQQRMQKAQLRMCRRITKVNL